jgi:hypothetical protein
MRTAASEINSSVMFVSLLLTGAHHAGRGPDFRTGGQRQLWSEYAGHENGKQADRGPKQLQADLSRTLSVLSLRPLRHGGKYDWTVAGASHGLVCNGAGVSRPGSEL